jgi:DNA-binding NarL/FixJ family response regulator
MTAYPTKVAIIEDQRTLREGFALLIGGTPGFECTGAFRSVEDAQTALTGQCPDVLLLDIELPGMTGVQGLPLLRARCPAMTVLMLTVYDDDDRVFDALCAGASGYLLKKTPPARLLESIKEAADGGAPMSPEIASKVVTAFRAVRPPKFADHDLTPHEIRLLGLLVEGHSYKSAASELGVSYNTICFHIKNIYGKLQVHSKSEAVTKALRNRLTQ